jgi:hypothetical protein
MRYLELEPALRVSRIGLGPCVSPRPLPGYSTVVADVLESVMSSTLMPSRLSVSG